MQEFAVWPAEREDKADFRFNLDNHKVFPDDAGGDSQSDAGFNPADVGRGDPAGDIGDRVRNTVSYENFRFLPV